MIASLDDLIIAPNGGLEDVEEFLGLQQSEGFPPLGMVFISIDLEMAIKERERINLVSDTSASLLSILAISNL